MPRKYKRAPGSRRYADYNEELLDECLSQIRTGRMSQREAADEYGISRSTIQNKLSGRHKKKIGRPAVFSEEEEDCFAHHMIKLADYNFPVTETDFKSFVKTYLEQKDRKVPQFKNGNLPGQEFVYGFLNRHPELSVRFSTNANKVRVEASEEVLTTYHAHLTSELNGIPPERIWNYDETNFSDNPGKKRVICRRGSKYVENKCNHSKTSISVMFCGNASGKLLPPYTVYKSEKMWDTWRENGPENAEYDRSKSGWFDFCTFERWFKFHFLHRSGIKRGDPPSAIIGDNLPTHINQSVIQLCEQFNVKFICLPPNTTHLSQPLDVAIFSPTKRIWRNLLREWKESADGRNVTNLQKDIFPMLLKKLMIELKKNIKSNLMAGFKKCGIYPQELAPLLGRLSEHLSTVDPALIGEIFIQKLEEKQASVSVKRQRKRFDIVPGQNITSALLAGNTTEEEDDG